MITDSVASAEAAEERPQVGYGLLMSKILELMTKLDSVTVMEDSVVIQFADCLKQLDDLSEKVDKKDLSNLISPIEEHIHTVYSLLNKFFDGKQFVRTYICVCTYSTQADFKCQVDGSCNTLGIKKCEANHSAIRSSIANRCDQKL